MDEAWERAVDVARGGEEHEDVRSLTLDGAVKCSQGRLPASSLLEQFSQLRVLSVANVGLASLTDFPALPHLERLNLSDNRISGGLESLVEAGLVSLRDLDLSNNKIQSLEDLAPLAKLNLLSLDLYECPVTRIPDYRVKVFSSINSLLYLDKVDVEDNERPESDEEEEEEEGEEEEEEEDDDDEDEDVDDGIDVDGLEASGLPKPSLRNRIDVTMEDEDPAEEDEESDEIDDEDEAVHYNGLGNHVGQGNGESSSDDGDDDDDDEEPNDNDEGAGDAVEVHDIEETDEDEDGRGKGQDEDDNEEEEEEDENVELALSLEGEIDTEEGAEEDDNGELGEDDVVIETEEDEEDDVEYFGSGYAVQAEIEGGSDLESGDNEDEDDDDDDDNDEQRGADAPALPLTKRKRSKGDASDESDDDEKPPKR